MSNPLLRVIELTGEHNPSLSPNNPDDPGAVVEYSPSHCEYLYVSRAGHDNPDEALTYVVEYQLFGRDHGLVREYIVGIVATPWLAAAVVKAWFQEYQYGADLEELVILKGFIEENQLLVDGGSETAAREVTRAKRDLRQLEERIALRERHAKERAIL